MAEMDLQLYLIDDDVLWMQQWIMFACAFPMNIQGLP